MISERSAETPEREHTKRGWLNGPDTIGQLLVGLLALWIGVGAIAATTIPFAIGFKISGALLFTTATLVVAHQAVNLIGAKRAALVVKDVPILWGLGRLVAWDPVEGVLFLRNKQLEFVGNGLEDCRGGLRCIYPILGDELALRVPLEVQTLEFADDEVLTREYLSVTIRGSMRWQIKDLRAFYLHLSRELRSTGELRDRRQQSTLNAAPASGQAIADATTGTKLMTAAIEWLRLLAEERTRTVVSRVSSGLLIAERMTDPIQTAANGGSDMARLSGIPSAIDGTHEPWRSATETLAESIAETVADGVANSGIEIARVSLQEIRLPAGVVQACIEAAQAAYVPLLAQRQASARRADLSADVDLLGKEAVGAREILSAAPGFTLVDFLSQFVSKQLGAGTGLAAGLVAGGALQSLEKTSSVPMTKEPT
jgi:regulator of protease activity HflC (stomatin/prohibitin superfamily)